MRKIWKFIKATLLGGILFLLPFAVAIVVVVKAAQIALRAADPLVELLPFPHPVAALAIDITGGILIALICFAAGLLAGSIKSEPIGAWLEEKLGSVFPPYNAIRTIGQNMAGMEADDTLRPVLVRNGEAWEIGLLSETHKGARFVSVFMPGSPNPWSGTVRIAATSDVRPIKVPLGQVLKSLKQSGRGLSESDLNLPKKR